MCKCTTNKVSLDHYMHNLSDGCRFSFTSVSQPSILHWVLDIVTPDNTGLPDHSVISV